VVYLINKMRKEGAVMQKLYEKNELWFALVWIGVYVVGTSVADRVSERIGPEKCMTLPFLLLLCALALVWLSKNGLYRKYGLCRSKINAAGFLYYLPLAGLASCNFWLGVRVNLSPLETALYVGSMLCVGFLEELIFRGFLFRAMCRDSVRAAIIVSSLTFGIGHLVNLVNGSGMGLLANLCQVCYAAAAGFLFVLIFHKGGSLLPCIVTHGVLNACSAFANEARVTAQSQIVTSVILTVLSLGYALMLLKLPAQQDE